MVIESLEYIRVIKPSFSLPNVSAFSARVFPSFSLQIRVFRVFRCSIIESLLVIGYRLLRFIGYGLLRFIGYWLLVIGY